ncbi:hypothetical protein MYCTH_2313991 [Thermothelomyces thermophilus ATCC 42464]|uniref:Altered inheritance of mitochondria protein 11 n=1 Tax=Thermothelomyces thermophilus (strain ATCC 42464 / BCRC 31852 / DSM 1799) TaxID=573729 RepID=G2Q021_THET4|nr:uncharacterized protein MYCTH_2313991 [Thermothelomyces thermophilus ATCC 42464]AEO54845.1 hypothetical protein MYCTH_2313991 [Thermothelomyces thermophilus ATCC 42464]
MTSPTAAVAPSSSSSPPPPPPPPPPPAQSATPQHDEPPRPMDYYNHYFSARSLRQLSLFLGGAGFFYLSVMVSRRAVARHRLASRLKFYEPNNLATSWGLLKDEELLRAMPRHKDPLVALEALNLATLNTVAFAVMAAGGVSWALDISNLDDLKRYARRRAVQFRGERDEAAEREVAEWLMKTFGIEEKKGSGGKDEGGRQGGGGDGGNGAEGDGKRAP